MYHQLNLRSQNGMLISSYIIEDLIAKREILAKTKKAYYEKELPLKKERIEWEKTERLYVLGSIDTYIPPFSSPLNPSTRKSILIHGLIPIFLSKDREEIDPVMRIDNLKAIPLEEVINILPEFLVR